MALLTQLYSTTRANRDRPMADNVTNHNAFLKTLDDKGMVQNADGGRELFEPLLYNEYDSETAKWYNGYETFSVNTTTEVVTGATYQARQLGGFSFISGREEHENRGKHAAVKLITAKDKALIATLKNMAAISLYSDGTGTGGLEWGGLQLLVADDPSAVGTVGGIDQVANTWWRNQTSVTAEAITAANIQSKMNSMYLACIRGTDSTDLILADLVTFQAYWESLQDIQRITDPKMGEAGFHTLKFMKAPVVYDTACPASRMYFLNSDFLIMRKYPGRYFTDEAPQPIQSADYTLFPNWTMSQLTCNNRSLQGVIGDST
jgi:hypothetical protein